MITDNKETEALIEEAIKTGHWADWVAALRAIRIERGIIKDGRK